MIKRLLKTTILLLLLFSLTAIYIVKRPSWVQVSETTILGNASESDLKEHVMYLSDVIKSRSYQTGNGLDQASHYIESEFKNHHDRVEVQTYKVNGMNYQNVLAIHGPDDAPVLVVGAHYDTYGGMPGADDNASGVAGILELNRLLTEHTMGGLALKNQIVLVAYTLEEPPIYASDGMGSVIHANSLQSRDVLLMISL